MKGQVDLSSNNNNNNSNNSNNNNNNDKKKAIFSIRNTTISGPDDTDDHNNNNNNNNTSTSSSNNNNNNSNNNNNNNNNNNTYNSINPHYYNTTTPKLITIVSNNNNNNNNNNSSSKSVKKENHHKNNNNKNNNNNNNNSSNIKNKSNNKHKNKSSKKESSHNSNNNNNNNNNNNHSNNNGSYSKTNCDSFRDNVLTTRQLVDIRMSTTESMSTTKRVLSTSTGFTFGNEHIVFLIIGCMVLFFMVCLPIDFYNYHKKRKDKKDRQGSSMVYSRTGPRPFHVIVNQESNTDETHQARHSKTRRPFFKFMGLVALLKKKPTSSDDQVDSIVDDGVTPSTSTKSMSVSTMYCNSVGLSADSMSPAEHIELPELPYDNARKPKELYNFVDEENS